jgi:hypothetical protein
VNVGLHAPAIGQAAAPETSEIVPLAQSYTVPGLGTVAAGTHATERHLTEALTARTMLAQTGTECHDCTDGRTRCFQTPVAGRFALGVYQMVKGQLVELTAFLTDESYLNEVLNDCDGSGGPPAPYAW